MPSNKKPRKKQRNQKSLLPLTIRHDQESERALQLMPHAELMKFREGIAEEASWHTIVVRLNIGMVAAQKFGHDSQSQEKALQAMLRVQERHNKTGRWALSGDDYRDIGAGLVATDNLQLSLTRRQLAEAIRYVYKNAAID